MQKSESEVREIADELNIKHKSSDNQEEIVYKILDEQAVINAAQKPAPRKRTRIVKKEIDLLLKTKVRSWTKKSL